MTDSSGSVNGSARPVVVAVLAGLLVLIALIAWSIVRENNALRPRSLCEEYAQFLTVGQDVREFDSDGASVADAEDITAEYLESVQQMQEARDGRYGTALDNLESAIEDALRTIEAVPADADADTWAPLVDDSLNDVAVAAGSVRAQVGPSCVAAN